MSWDYGFGELENQLIEAGKEYPPNYEKMRELFTVGADINAISTKEDPDESILSTIILGYPNDFNTPQSARAVIRMVKSPVLIVRKTFGRITTEDIFRIYADSFCKTDLMYMGVRILLAVVAL